MRKYVEFPHINKQFSDTGWGSKHSWTPFWHSLCRGSIRFHQLKTQPHKTALHFKCQWQGQILTCVQLIGYRLELPTITSLGWIDLLEWSQNSRKQLTSLMTGLLLTCKEQVIWERCTGHSMGRGWYLSYLSTSLSPSLHLFTNLEAVQTWSFVGFFWRLHR